MGKRSGGHITKRGYIRRMINGETDFDHIRICEKALGGSLPVGAVVHHVDGNPSNNSNTNLVICPDNTYHRLIHLRIKAVKATGNPNARKCRFCKQYDNPENLSIKPSGVHHKKCMNKYYRDKRKEQCNGNSSREL